MSGRWASSNRRNELPTCWPKMRAQVRKRDKGLCQWPVGQSICGATGRDVDHRGDKHDHRLEALWLLCPDHHKGKTQTEAIAGRVFERRAAERHPGLL